MRKFKRNLWKAGSALALLFFLVLMMWVPVSAATHQKTSQLGTLGTVTVQATPTEDATVTTLNKEKLKQEVLQLQEQNAPDLFGWLRTNAALLFSTLVVVIGGLIGLFRWFGDRRSEREKRAEERFQAAVIGLGADKEGARIGAAILLRTFLRSGYEQFYTQTFDLAVANLRLPRISDPPQDPDLPLSLTTLSQALIVVFKEAFPLARGQERKKSQSLDATSIQLDNAYLYEVDLRQVWMPQSSLRKANFSKANLSKANLSKANLSEAHLYRTNLSEADLSKANLSGAHLSEAHLYRTNLSEADLSKANLSGVSFNKVNPLGNYFSGANLSGANLSGANLKQVNSRKVDFNGVDFSGANFSGADLSGTFLSGANLRRVNLSGANLRRVNLSEVDFSGANFSGADLSKAHLRTANLLGFDLSGVNLSGADLSEADLRQVNFSRANLSKAKLYQTDLTGANLSEADLSGASFGKVVYRTVSNGMDRPGSWPEDFLGADPNGANIEAAQCLRGTNLRGVKGLTRVQLEACKARGAIIDEDSTTNAAPSTITHSPPSQSDDAQDSSTLSTQGSTAPSGSNGSSAVSSSQPDEKP